MSRRFERYVILIRHGEAVPEAVDPERPLSAAGRERVGRTGAWLRAAGLRPDLVVSGAKLRARQTARLVAAAAGVPPERLAVREDLAPAAPVEPWVDELEAETRNVALVGHLPMLGLLLSALLVGDPQRLGVAFADGAAAVVERSGGRWVLAAFVAPELLPVE